MSAVDITARALALRAAAAAAGGGGSGAGSTPAPPAQPAALQTFAMMQQTPPAIAGSVVESAGHAAPGLGKASYVSDSMATAALAAAHPQACFAASDGRHFRLLGDHEGFITPEQMGCPTYSAGTNQRSAVQAALDYGKAVGLAGVKFPQQRYELWCPVRLGGFDDQSNHSGSLLVIDGCPCTLLGLHPLRTTLVCKGPAGGNLQSDYQTVLSQTHGGDVIWRGHGIKLAGAVPLTQARPADGELAHLTLRNLALQSDAQGVRNTSTPALPPSRDASGLRQNCRDLSNCGVFAQPGVHIGHIAIENADIAGFLGDALTAPGGYLSRVSLTRLAVRDSNGAALNLPGPLALGITAFTAENCGISWEGFGGLLECRVDRARFMACGSGGLNSASRNADGLRDDGTAPVMQMDLAFENCDEQQLGAYLSGTLAAVDTAFAFAPDNATRKVRGVDVTILSTCHKANVGAAIRYAGFPGAAAGISDTIVRLSLNRTRHARDQGFNFLAMAAQSGALGAGNYLYARGQPALIGTASGVADNYVAIIDEGLDLTSSANAPTLFDPTTSPSPDMGTGALRGGVFSTGNGVFPVNLPATAMYQEGAEISIEHRDAAKTAAFMEVVESGQKRALLGYRDRVRFRCNKLHNRWDMVSPPPQRMATASIALTSTSTGMESGPYQITLPGCRPWHRVDITPSASLVGFMIYAIRAENDLVRFWVKNQNGLNPSSLAAQTFSARCFIAPS